MSPTRKAPLQAINTKTCILFFSFSPKQTQAGLFLNRPSNGNHSIDFFTTSCAYSPALPPSFHSSPVPLPHSCTLSLSLSHTISLPLSLPPSLTHSLSLPLSLPPSLTLSVTPSHKIFSRSFSPSLTSSLARSNRYNPLRGWRSERERE